MVRRTVVAFDGIGRHAGGHLHVVGAVGASDDEGFVGLLGERAQGADLARRQRQRGTAAECLDDEVLAAVVRERVGDAVRAGLPLRAAQRSERTLLR